MFFWKERASLRNKENTFPVPNHTCFHLICLPGPCTVCRHCSALWSGLLWPLVIVGWISYSGYFRPVCVRYDANFLHKLFDIIYSIQILFVRLNAKPAMSPLHETQHIPYDSIMAAGPSTATAAHARWGAAMSICGWIRIHGSLLDSPTCLDA